MVRHPSPLSLLQPKERRQRREQQFDPITACQNAKLRSVKWVFLDGNPSSEEVTEPAFLLGELDGVLDGDLRRVTDIPFRDRDSFKAGELQKDFNTWEAVLNGSEIQTVMDHVDWKTSFMARHYIKLNQVFGSGGVGDLLSTMPGDLTNDYRRENELLFFFSQAF